MAVLALVLAIGACLVLIAWNFEKCNPPWAANEAAFLRTRQFGQSMNLRDISEMTRLQDEMRASRDTYSQMAADVDQLHDRLNNLESRSRRPTGLLSTFKTDLEKRMSMPLPVAQDVEAESLV